MMKHTLATAVCCSALLCATVAGKATTAYQTSGQTQAASSQQDESFTATVKPDEARFTLPVPARHEWKWHQPETKERMREYAFDVKVMNEGNEFTFGFYLWKFPGARPRAGSLSALIADGQRSVFGRSQSHMMTIIRDAGVKVKQEGDNLLITVSGKKNVARLFSGRPAEVLLQISVLEEAPTSQTVPVKYEN